jgi:hypothetical protein
VPRAFEYSVAAAHGSADTATGVTVLPGCCNGPDERHDWRQAVDGGRWASLGHGPSPLAERRGDTVRLTVDAELGNSPVIELPVTRRPPSAERQARGAGCRSARWIYRGSGRRGAVD